MKSVLFLRGQRNNKELIEVLPFDLGGGGGGVPPPIPPTFWPLPGHQKNREKMYMEACERGADTQTLTDLAAAAAAAAALRDFCNGSEIRAHVENISYRAGCFGETATVCPSVRPSL